MSRRLNELLFGHKRLGHYQDTVHKAEGSPVGRLVEALSTSYVLRVRPADTLFCRYDIHCPEDFGAL